MPLAPEDVIEVLFVEDDDDFAAAVAEVASVGLKLTRARSASEARMTPTRFSAAVVDLGLPDEDGVSLIRWLVAQHHELPIVVLTNAHDPDRVVAAFRAGARGYLFKEDADRLHAAIAEAMSGGAPMSREVARWVLEWARGPRDTPATSDAELTPRELDLVRLLAGGCSYAQVAGEMGVSINTVRTHVRNVYEKLAVGNRTEAVMAALRLGLIER